MRAFLFPLALVLALAIPAHAAHCTTWSTTTPEVTLGVYGTTPVVYVDGVYNAALETYDLWVYQESNGLEGLQHDDESIDDTCHGMIVGDTIIF